MTKIVTNMTLFGEDSDEELEDLPAMRAIIVKSKMLMNEPMYVIRLVDNLVANSYRHVMRRYEDFAGLDESLRVALSTAAWGSAEAQVSYVPELPRKGRFGVRQSLSSMGIGNFNERLKEDLQNYLHAVLLQVTDLDGCTPVNDFFNAAITEATRQRWENPSMRKAAVTAVKNEAEMNLAGGRQPQANSSNAALYMLFLARNHLRELDEATSSIGVPRTEDEARREIFKSGDWAVIVGLQDKPHHNAKLVQVTDYLDAVRQYRVTLDTGKVKRLRDVNIRRAPAPEADGHIYKENVVGSWKALSARLLVQIE